MVEQESRAAALEEASVSSGAERERLHRRTIVIDGYRRKDGLWDIEGEITDVKTIDHPLKTYTHPAHTPLHRMKLRITVDDTLTIRDAKAVSIAAPYNPDCSAVVPAYKGLIGLQIKGGFRAEVARRVGGISGCTHITELIGNLATAAVQTTAGLLRRDESVRPMPLGGCYAWRESGPIVQEYFPKWYKSASPPEGDEH